MNRAIKLALDAGVAEPSDRLARERKHALETSVACR
jgi:hypothetical protein